MEQVCYVSLFYCNGKHKLFTCRLLIAISVVIEIS